MGPHKSRSKHTPAGNTRRVPTRERGRATATDRHREKVVRHGEEEGGVEQRALELPAGPAGDGAGRGPLEHNLQDIHLMINYIHIIL